MKEELYIFGTALMRMPIGGLLNRLRILQEVGVAVISLFPMLIPGIKKLLGVMTNT
jgi:hypothetical protein